MSDQIDSTKPAKPAEKQHPPEMQAILEESKSWSSMNLLSVDVHDLMADIIAKAKVPEALKTEDQTYVSNALNMSRFSKHFLRAQQEEKAIFFALKAHDIIEELVKLRKGDFPEYQVLLAPFLFRLGDYLAEYVSLNLDEMGQMKPLVLPDDEPTNDAYGDEEDGAEEEEPKKDGESEAKEEEPKAEDEPKIEDVDDQIQEKKPSDENKSAAGESANGVAPACPEYEELSTQIFQLLDLANQIIGDFTSGSFITDGSIIISAEDKASRKKMLSSLQIDATLRTAEYARVYQDIDNTVESYEKVIDLCKEYPEGNQRILGSAYLVLGTVNLSENKREQAKQFFEKSIETVKAVLMKELKAKGEVLADDVTIEQLQVFSIYDDEGTRGLKESLKDTLEFIKECSDMDKMQPELDKMKKETEVPVSKEFGEVPKDSETFKPVKIKTKKRALTEVSGFQPDAEGGEKKQKVEE